MDAVAVPGARSLALDAVRRTGGHSRSPPSEPAPSSRPRSDARKAATQCLAPSVRLCCTSARARPRPRAASEVEPSDCQSFCDPFSDNSVESGASSLADGETGADARCRKLTRRNPSSGQHRCANELSAQISVAEGDFASAASAAAAAAAGAHGTKLAVPEAADLIAVSSWSEVENNEIAYERPGCYHHSASGYDCICQHSCSSSISSLGLPDLDGFDATDTAGDDQEDGGVARSKAHDTHKCTEFPRKIEAINHEIHNAVMMVFEHQHCDAGIADDERSGKGLDQDSSDGLCDSMGTIEMQVKEGGRHGPDRHEGSTLALFPPPLVQVTVRSALSVDANVSSDECQCVALATSAVPDGYVTESAHSRSGSRSRSSSIAHDSLSCFAAERQQAKTMRRTSPSLCSKLLPGLSCALRTPNIFSEKCLPDDMVTAATCFLDIPSLLNLRVTCRNMRDLASRDEAGWFEACRRLWRSKVNLCPEAIDMIESSKKRLTRERSKKAKRQLSRTATRQSYGAMGAYRVSSDDAKERDVVTIEELCYDAQAFLNPSSDEECGEKRRRSSSSTFRPHSGHQCHGPIWSFRFKEASGPDWTRWDPWWSGGEARKMVFLKDGTVMQIVSRKEVEAHRSRDRHIGNDKKRGHEVLEEDGRVLEADRANGYMLVSALSDGLDVTDRRLAGGEEGSATAMNQNESIQDNAESQRRSSHPRPKIDIRWRLVSEPMDMPKRPHGAYIRLTVGNRDVPTYVVRRSPTNNWGFILESCWGLYASFELPKHRTVRGLRHPSGAQIPRARMRLRRTRYGSRWVNVNEVESDDEEERERRGDITIEDGGESLLEDAAMTVTNGRQWREALMYNFGAITLPSGSRAAEDFDRYVAS